MQDDRDDFHRNKLNTINNKIYDKALQYSGYLENNLSNSPKVSEPFYLKNDHEFNRRLAEMKFYEKDMQKKDLTKVNERLKEEQIYRYFQSKMKLDKMDNQKNYKDFLDNQAQTKNFERNQKDIVEVGSQLIMPSYHLPNRPVVVSKKAVDGITWVKNNHLETLQNGHKNFYLGDTILKHNPITTPLNDFDYNKYINKQRLVYGNSSNASNSPSLAKAGNQLFASY
jgi:hypothetical protein